jgi:hypothetical protein
MYKENYPFVMTPAILSKMTFLRDVPFEATNIQRNFGDDAEGEIAAVETLCQEFLGVPLSTTMTIDTETMGQELVPQMQKLWKEIPAHARIHPKDAIWSYVPLNHFEFQYLMSDWDGILWLIRAPKPV